MNITAGTVPVPLTVFGGAVTEMAPEDLPEGASPFNQDMDFVPGAAFTRGGRQGVYVFSGLFAEDLAGFAINDVIPNLAAWTNPLGAVGNVPGSPASVTLNTSAGNGFGNPLTSFVGNRFAVTLTSAPLNVAAGSLIVIAAQWSDAGTCAFSDNAGNTFVTPTPSSGANPNHYVFNFIQVAYTLSSTAHPAFQVTATFSFGGGNNFENLWVWVFPLTRPALFEHLDLTSSSGGAGIQKSQTAPAVNTTGNNELVVVMASDGGVGQGAWGFSENGVGGVLTVDSAGFGTGQIGGYGAAAHIIYSAPQTGLVVTSTKSVGANSGCLPIICFSSTAPASGPTSEPLLISNFGFNIPVTASALGFNVQVFGHQSTQAPDGQIKLSLVNPSPTSPSYAFQLPAVDGQTTFPFGANAAASITWGLAVTPALLNNPNFAVQLQAFAAGGSLVTFSVYAVKIRVFFVGSPVNFNYVKTFEQTTGRIDTLALDATGVLWDEDVTNLPSQLSGIYTGILPNTFAKSETFQDVEYIALSNLLNGTDIPRHWDGEFLDRVSQVGPGAPPAVNATATTYAIAPSPTGVTQNPAVTSDLETTGQRAILWSAGPGTTSTGNTITVYYSRVTFGRLTPDPLIVVGNGIRVQGWPNISGQNPNGNYIVTAVGVGVPPNGNFSNPHFYFTVQTTIANSGFFFTPNSGTPGTSYQVTIATLTTLTPLPNTQVGSQIQLSGVLVAAWNATWTVLATPNAGVLSITSTQLLNNVATYTFTLISGVAPTVGQQISIAGCLNGPIVGGTSIFNIQNGIVSAVGANQFSIAITAPNVSSAAENGSAQVNGTKFQFDPGIQFAGTGTNPIFGNSGNGQVVVGGAGLGAGVRKAVVMFKTRNNLITAASPPIIFATTGGSTQLVFSNIPIGPADVIARIIAITGAGGDNYFWIEQPTVIQSGGQNITYTATIVNDNVSTTAVFTFTDAILLAATAIDITGNNLFNQMELGSCRGFLSYANRLIAWGEQNKIQNLLNLSFDGGIGVAGGGTTTFPLGWTVDPTNGNGGNLRVSPVFGNSYYIQNLTGGVQALYGMIEQTAFQDAFKVAIVLPATKYSVRITARCPSGVVAGNLVVDLFSPLLNRIFGSFTVPLANMTSNFAIFTGTLLTTVFPTTPPDLLFRVYASALPNNGDVEIDRVEPFPTSQPTFSTQMRASYAGNQEAFDLVTGAFGPAQNQEPLNGGFVMDDVLYALKEKSMFSTSDNGVTEPFKWNWREVSKKAGTAGIHSYDAGERWLATACRPGLYFFEGGEPIKLSQEIQSVWDLINWKQFGHTVWVRNDTQLKRITVGVPIPTPNPFMPEFPVNANPTSPNVILMCSYRGLDTGTELAHGAPVHSTYSGRLISPEGARKWSFWNIACPYSDLINRGNNDWTQFFCTGYGNSKIFQLSSAELDDDGVAINSFYVTHGIPRPDIAESKGLGLYTVEFDYLTMLITGQGNAFVQVYPESVQNPLPYPIDTYPLQSFTQGDYEFAVNLPGNRFYVRVGSNAVGSAFRLSKIVAALSKGAWSEVSGSGVGTA